MAKCVFIIYGDYVKDDFSNVQSISTKVVPNIGEKIFFKKETLRIKDKLINYSQVEEYDLKEDGRGKEVIYLFV